LRVGFEAAIVTQFDVAAKEGGVVLVITDLPVRAEEGIVRFRWMELSAECCIEFPVSRDER
jgi:hypothetical protein